MAPLPMRRLPLLLLLILGCGDTPSPPAPTGNPNSAAQPSTALSTPEELPPPAEPVAFLPPPLSAAEISAGWVSLFDGASLFGWQIL